MKINTFAHLAALQVHKSMVKVMIFGTFDLLHLGHVDFLHQAKLLGDELIVVVARDSSVEKIKGEKPFFSQEERRKMVESLKPVDCAVIGNEENFFTVVEKYQPDVIALGYDQKTFTEDFIAFQLKQLGLNTRIVRLKHCNDPRFKSSALKRTVGEIKWEKC